MNMALLIIDMQKAYYLTSAKESMAQAVEDINHVVELFRKNNKKIIWTQDERRDIGLVRGTEWFKIIDTLEPRDDEKIIIKEYDNAFNKTELYEYLINEKIDTIIITGCLAEYCVLSTYRGAKDKDIRPLVLKNAIASGKKDYVKFVEETSKIITIERLEKIINNK
ncbi:nicotinamidase [Spirochaetia bacterium]|nr:nicotinamidase [Spirochaetia bacterium]